MESLTECQFRWFEQYIALSRLCLWNSCWDIYSKDKGREWMISGSLAPSHRPTSGHIFLMTSSNKNSLQINEDGSDITVTAKREMGRIQRKEKLLLTGHLRWWGLHHIPFASPVSVFNDVWVILIFIFDMANSLVTPYFKGLVHSGEADVIKLFSICPAQLWRVP